MNNQKSQADRTGLRVEELVQMALQIGAGAIDVVAVSPSDISVEDDLANEIDADQSSMEPIYGLVLIG